MANLYVQIAVFPSREAAEAALASLRQRSEGVLALHPSVTEPLNIDGQQFHRALLGGFRSVAEAQALCDQLKDEVKSCVLRLR